MVGGAHSACSETDGDPVSHINHRDRGAPNKVEANETTEDTEIANESNDYISVSSVVRNPFSISTESVLYEAPSI
jgi:hypothetical protein